MIYQVIVEEDRTQLRVIASVYQGLHKVGQGWGKDGVSAVCDAFTDLQRRNDLPIATREMKPL